VNKITERKCALVVKLVDTKDLKDNTII